MLDERADVETNPGPLGTVRATFGTYDQRGPWVDVRTLTWEDLCGLLTAHTVGANDVIARLPLEYDEPLTEGGANLSMGERQLLSFARAVVHDPDVLILDEATSSVDPGTERRLQASMAHMLSGRTALVIAHRLATVVAANRILVVHGGRIVQSGTHDYLYAQPGVYRDLFDLQFQKAQSA